MPPPQHDSSGGAAEAARFLARNTVDCLPEGALERKLQEGRPLRVKLGVDPTAADIHLGHTVVLQKLREFQELGHTVVLIIGDYTARVGDPSGRSTLRPVLSPAEIEANARTYQEQALKVLDDRALEVRFNGEWLDMSMEQLFALTRTTTVGQLLERDDFSKRYAAREPISVLELLYPLLQGYDSVAVRADVELGGTDQKFNLLLGRNIQRAYHQPEQVIMTMPLLTGTNGERKMSKSYGNQIGVADPPEEIYGRTLSIPDPALGDWYALLLGTEPDPTLSPRDAKRALARALAERFYDAAAAARCRGGLRPRVRPRSDPRGRADGDVEAQRRRRCTCRRCWPRPSASRRRRRGAASLRERSASTARWSRPMRWTCRRGSSSTAACCSSASGASRAWKSSR